VEITFKAGGPVREWMGQDGNGGDGKGEDRIGKDWKG
jgi:hypothetical protein